MIRLFLCVSFILGICLPLPTLGAPLYFATEDSTPVSSALKTRVERLFDRIDAQFLEKDEIEKQKYLSSLEKRIVQVGQTLKTKNIEKFARYAPLLDALLSRIYTRQSAEVVQADATLGENTDWDIMSFTPKSFEMGSGSLDTTLGEFTLSQDTTVNSLEITIVSDSKIILAGQKKYVRIQRADGSINIALSTALEVESDTQLVVKFSSAIFMKAGSYRFNGLFENTGNTFYDTYIDSVKIGNKEFSQEKGAYKIGETSVQAVEKYVFDTAGIKKKDYSVEEIGTFLGAFEVYGDEFFFENLRLKVSANRALDLDKDEMYLLDASGDIFAKDSGYEEKNGDIYVSFRNVVLREGIYQLGLTEILGDPDITEVNSQIDDYILSTLKVNFKNNYLDGFPLTHIEVK